MNIYLLLWVIILYYFIIYLLLYLFYISPLRALSLVSVTLWHILTMWGYSEHFLTFWHYNILQAHLVYFLYCPSLRISHFSKECFYWRMVLENQDLGIKCFLVTAVSFFLDHLNWESKEIYMCILSYIYIYRHTCFLLCKHLYLH